MLSDGCVVVLKHIWALEGEREAQGQEATEAAQRHAQALEQVKLRDMAAADLQKKVPCPALLCLPCFLCMHASPCSYCLLGTHSLSCLTMSL